jgi:beta-lactamase regulating signal transducer with metallopeptidase domain/polyhydroxyalkanoate synthesis regulator phasin
MTTPILFDAIGWAVLHSLWQGFLIGGVVLLLLHANRTHSASMRHAIAFLGLLAMLLAFVTTTTLLLVDGSDTASRVVASTATSGHLETATSTNDIPSPDRATANTSPLIGATERDLSWLPGVITWAWLAGVGLMTVRLFGQWCWSRRLRHRGTEPTDAAWTTMFDSLKARCGVGERVRLLVSRTIDSPMVVGWLHPVVLMPASVFTALDPEQLRTILVHELHHLARRDHLLNMVQAVIEAVLFFHPVTWWLSRQVRIERELRCDDATLEIADSPRSLAEALLALESLRTLNDTRASFQLAATGGSLMHRITRLTGSSPQAPNCAGWRIISASTILAVAGASIAATSSESPAASQPQVQRADDPAKVHPDIGERLHALGVELRKQVAAGEMTAEDAKVTFNAAKEKMWRRHDMTEKKAEGELRDSPNLATLKSAIEQRLKALGVELDEQVAAGEMTAEEAKIRFDAAVEKMWHRYRMAEKKVGGEHRESQKLATLKASIEARLVAMGTDLRRQVAAGYMTAEDAKAKYDAAGEHMWSRYHMAEKKAAEGDRRESQDRDELKIAIEERLQTMSMELRLQVADGEMTAEDAKARYDAAEQQMWRRYRQAEKKAVADD